ncbi:hypothetical protein ACGFNU_44940 [Spirillospora sp. NPDC048911]|uniref:hypothetical protein n=1 Tax=Spirillospora sp. NPDC048911 TaxID=3364527 RepID=UPI0037212E9E
MKSFSYTELDLLVGEILPERAVLSTLLAADGDSFNNNNAGGVGGGVVTPGGSTVVVNACQSNLTYPDGGLLQSVGLNAAHQTTSFTCSPGSVVSGH